MTATTAPKVHLCSEQRAELESAGVSGPALALCLKSTAHLRRQSRIWYVQWAAKEHVLDMLGRDKCHKAPEVALYTRAIMLAEHYAELGGTTRHPAFSTCGKGRKLATDGPAWTDAIAAATQIDGEYGVRGWFTCTEEGLRIQTRPDLHPESDFQLSLDPTLFLPAEWHYAMLSMGLKIACKPWGKWDYPFAAEKETLPYWAAAYNKFVEANPNIGELIVLRHYAEKIGIEVPATE